MEKQIEIFAHEDGFYAGVMLKKGQLGKGAYRITDEDIMTMFSTLCKYHHDTTGEPKMLMRDAEGRIYATVIVDPGKPKAEQVAMPAKNGKPKKAGSKARSKTKAV